jgi:hypothetical protein
MLSPIQVLTGGTTTALRMNCQEKVKMSWKSKVTAFKRKCRARGLNEEQIIVLIHQRNHLISEQLLNDQIIHEQIKEANKRKRDQSQQNLLNSSVKSMSQLSISQEATVSKKMKKSTNETISSNGDNNNQSNENNNIILYKPSKYLRMPRKLLLHSLRLQLKYSLKKKKEQKFILSRLVIIDRQFCLEQICYLYQTFFDQGAQHQIWPVSFNLVLSTYIIIFIFDILRMIFSK